jgi:hypothetical protein
MIAYKALIEYDDKLRSFNLDPASKTLKSLYPYSLEYEEGKLTYPAIGLLFVFETEFQARWSARSYKPRWSVQIWEVEARNPSTPVYYVPSYISDYPLFWELFEDGADIDWDSDTFHGSIPTPAGTLCCDAVRLIRRI